MIPWFLCGHNSAVTGLNVQCLHCCCVDISLQWEGCMIPLLCGHNTVVRGLYADSIVGVWT